MAVLWERHRETSGELKLACMVLRPQGDGSEGHISTLPFHYKRIFQYSVHLIFVFIMCFDCAFSWAVSDSIAFIEELTSFFTLLCECCALKLLCTCLGHHFLWSCDLIGGPEARGAGTQRREHGFESHR